MSHPLPVLAVGIAMAFLSVMALRAWRRTGNRVLVFVAAAFGVFALKEAFIAYALQTGSPAHENLELAATALDLLIAGLLLAPFVLRPRRA